MDEKMLEVVRELRAPYIKFRNVASKIIFGPSQRFGHRVFSNTTIVSTQAEELPNNVSTWTCFGPPASGKTAAANTYSMLMSCPAAFIFWGPDIMSAQLYGFLDYNVIGTDGQPKYRPGILKPETYNMFICDELVRGTISRLNDLGPIFAEGKIIIEGQVKNIAPPNEPLIIVATSNPLGSAGTKTVPDFIVDRLIAGNIFGFSRENRRQLLESEKHWKNVREQGLQEPILTPRMIMETRRFLENMTTTPENVLVYMEKILDTVDLLTTYNWAKHFPKDTLPAKWQALQHIPSEPLFHPMGGRTSQHLEMLSRADSFLTYGSLVTVANRTENSVQAMAQAVFAHRFMYLIHEGGIDLRDAAHGEDILDFVKTVTQWVISLVPPPL